MSLTPDEIAAKEFLVGLRGYDKDEVRAFLQTVAAAYDAKSAAPAPAAAALGHQRPRSCEPREVAADSATVIAKAAKFTCSTASASASAHEHR